MFKQEIRFQGKPVELAALNNRILLEDPLTSGVKEDYQKFLHEIMEDLQSKLGH